MDITNKLSFIKKAYTGSFILVCKHTNPQILQNYFHARKIFLTIKFGEIYKQKNYVKVITNLVRALDAKEQISILLDFYIISFFVTNAISFDFLVKFYSQPKKSLQNLLLLPITGAYDYISNIVTYYPKQAYDCYSLHSHLEKNLKIYNNDGERLHRKVINVPLLLQSIISRDTKSFIDKENYIEDFYINKIATVGMIIDYKHMSLFGFRNLSDNIKDIESVEIVALMKFPHITNIFKKTFIMDNKGNTSLSYNIIDFYIRRSLEPYFILPNIADKKLIFFKPNATVSKRIFKTCICSFR